MQQETAIMNSEELLKRKFFIYEKFSVYVYLTFYNQGLFDDVDKSVEEVAREYQVEMLAKNTLEKQQKRLVAKLLTVDEDATLNDSVDTEEMPVIDEEICTPSAVVEEPQSQPLQTEREKETLRFLQALTKMKMFVNSSMSVSMKTVQDLLTPIVDTSQSEDEFESPFSDSGYSTFNSQSSSMSLGKVSTISLNNIMRGSKCNQILSNSIDVILKGLKNVITKNDLSVYENWPGSHNDSSVCLLNQLVEIFCQEIEENCVRTKCSEFTQSIIQGLITFPGMDNTMQKLKYYFLILFIRNVYVCYDTINFLFEKIIRFETCSKDRTSCHKIPIGSVENCYYIFVLLKSLLTYYISETKAQKNTGSTPMSRSEGSVASSDDFFEIFGDNCEEQTAQITDQWKTKVNQLMTSFTGVYSVVLVSTMELLDTLM